MNQELEKALYIATQIAEEHKHDSFGPAHLIKASLNRDLSLLRYLHGLGVDVYFIEEWADMRLEIYPKKLGRGADVRASAAAKGIIVEAANISTILNKDNTDLVCLFVSAITPGVGFDFDQLKSLPISSTELINRLSPKSKGKCLSGIAAETDAISANTVSSKILKKYTKDLLEEAKNGRYDQIVDRDKELKIISEILSRMSKSNLIVQGEPGVGKTVLIQNLALEIVKGKIVDTLRKVNLLEVETSALFSGASYKGEIEDRLQQIFTEAKTLYKPVIFIDDFHSLFYDISTSQGILNVIKSELNKGEVIIIGAISSNNYRKHIAADVALLRRFESILLEEADFETTFRVLKRVGKIYSEHHGLKVEKETLREAIRLSQRYVKEKNFPDSALDLIDRTMAAANVSKQSLPSDIKRLKADLANIKIKTKKLSEAKKIQEIDWLYMGIKNRLSPIILAKLDTEDFFRFTGYTDRVNYVIRLLKSIEEHEKTNRTHINNADLAAMVSNITGIPAGKVQTHERERLMEMEDTLKQRVIGQDKAVQTVVEAIIESRSGLSKEGRPIGSFFFSGPTGTGKTELAKSMAEFLFNDESAIIRFDMSEFKEEHSAALLYGAPPGYVGYEEGGVLVNKIRQKPYSIVLFDEIEKAHQSVFDVFLQILDEGKLSDRLGKEGDFSNAVILFTSNIGSEFITKSIEGGKIPPSDKLLQIMSGYFRPEFLGRITEIVPFAPISKKNAPLIFNLHLKKELIVLTERLGINLEIDEKTRTYLSLEGFSSVYGVRPLKAVIRNKLKKPLSKMIISGQIKAPQTIQVTLKDKKVLFNVIKQKSTIQQLAASD